MEHGPVPPHERTWRHPSELGPTAADVVDRAAGGGWALAVTTGAVAAVVAAVMVISFSGSGSDAPTAVSATTVPAMTLPTANLELAEPVAAVQLGASTVTRDQRVSLVGAPNAVSAVAIAEPDDLDLADETPADDERVILLTESHTYEITWGDLDRLEAPDGAIVITPDGCLIATFVSGEIRLLVD